MPIYEYQCDVCGSRREIILRPGEQARPMCTPCRKRMRRVISQTAFILKGAGWYVTDYPSDARKKGMDADKPAPAVDSTPAKKETPPAGKKSDAQPASPAVKKSAKQRK